MNRDYYTDTTSTGNRDGGSRMAGWFPVYFPCFSLHSVEEYSAKDLWKDFLKDLNKKYYLPAKKDLRFLRKRL